MALGADKDLHPFGLAAGVEQAQHGFPGLQHAEQRAQPFDVGERRHILQQIGLAAHDERALPVAAGPARNPGRDEREVNSSMRLLRTDLLLDLGAGLLDRAADQPRIEKIAGRHQPRAAARAAPR